MSLWATLPETLLLVTALSLDAFVASFAYGAGKIKIPCRSVLIINGICTLLLALGLLLSMLINPYLPDHLAKSICFLILFLLGLVKLGDSTVKSLIKKHTKINKKFRFSLFSLSFILNVYASPEKADEDCSQVLNAAEAGSLALALSLDGLAVGFGTGMAGINMPQLLVSALLIGMLAIIGGCHLGNRIASRSNVNLSWLSGLILIILAFLKL